MRRQNIEKSEIINNLKTILMYYGCKPGPSYKSNWDCVPNRHESPKEDLSIRGDVCCCHCDLKGDALNVIKIMEGYNDSKEDFIKILNKGAEILNLDGDTPARFKETKKIEKPVYDRKDFTEIINNNFRKAKRKDYKYFYDRGIRNDNVFLKVKPIVGITEIFPHQNIPQVPNRYDYNFIIPVWENGIVRNAILRRNDKKSTYGKKTLNLKNLEVKFFNSDCLDLIGPEIIFITEGIFDALSFMEFFQESICLNSALMANKFNQLIKEKKDNLKDKIFVIALDNDPEGQRAQQKIKENLKELNIKHVSIKLDKQYKDINDFLVKDREGFNTSLMKTIEFCEKKLNEEG